MGMDIAEIVMEIEDKYDLSIPEDELGIKTVGAFAAYVRFRLSEQTAPRRCFTSLCFFRLRSALRKILGNPQQRLRTGDRLPGLRQDRDPAAFFRDTRAALGNLSHTLPEHTTTLDGLRFLGSLVAACGVFTVILFSGGVNEQVAAAAFLLVLCVFCFLLVGWVVRKRVDFPAELATLGDVATFMAKRLKPEDLDGCLPALPSDQQILLEIRELVAQSVSLPLEKITADTDIWTLD